MNADPDASKREPAARAYRLVFLAAMVAPALGPLVVSGAIPDPPTAQKRFILLAVVAAWVCRLVLVRPGAYRPARRGSGAARGCDAWVAAYALSLVLSVVLSPERGISLRDGLFQFVSIAYYFLLAGVLAFVPGRRRIVSLLTWVAAILAAIGILQYVGIEPLRYTGRLTAEKEIVLATLGHPNYVASFLGPICFIAGILALDARTAARGAVAKTAVGAAMLLFLACIVMAGARGVWLGMLAAAAFLAAVLAVRGRRILPGAAWKSLAFLWGAAGAAALAVTVLLLVPNPILKSRFDLRQRVQSSREIHARLFYWAVADEMIRDAPVFGIGYGRFSTTFWHRVAEMTPEPENAPYREYLMRTPTLSPGEAHNEYIEIAAEMGFVGLAAFLGMAWWFVLSALRPVFAPRAVPGTEGTRRATLLLLVAALLVVLVDALFAFPLQLPASGLLFWILLALLRSEIESAS